MKLKSDFSHSFLILTAILFVLFLSSNKLKAQVDDARCNRPAPLGQSEKAAVIKNVRQIIGGYNPSEATFNNLRAGWFEYFRCVEAPALREADKTKADELYNKISQSALSSAVQSIELEAGNSEAKSVKAQVMILIGNRTAAEEFVHQALALDIQNFEAHFLLGILNSDLASIERSITLNPSFAAAYNLKAELLLSQASKLTGAEQLAKYQAALETIKAMLALPSPPEPVFWQEQQNAVIHLLNPSLPSTQFAGGQTNQTKPALPAVTPLPTANFPNNDKPGDKLETGGVGSGTGGGVGSGIGNGGEAGGLRGPEKTSAVDAANPNRKLNILSTPRANYTELARMTQTTGTVRVRVTLSSDGQIRDVLVLSFLPFGLTQQAVKAAKQLKFTPEMLNNTPVSVSKIIEYNFNLY